MELNNQTVSSRQLGCLGLIAAVIRKLKIIEKVDEKLDVDFDKGAIVSCGERVAAMILNGLGFMNSRLYMTPHYFQDKPVGIKRQLRLPVDDNYDCRLTLNGLT